MEEASWAQLHRDALYEILLRVPAKPLCCFRAVCRSWRSLLSSPSFVAAHAARHRDQPLLAVCDWVHGSGCETAEMKLLDTSGRVVKRFGVGQSSLLCRVWSHLDLTLIVRRDDHRPLSVLDTATGTVSRLPGGYYGETTRSSFVFGRAAASSTGGDDGEYKVLSFNNPIPHLNTQPPFCKILTVNSGGGSHGAWRDAPAPPVAIKTFHSETVVASGVVYHLVDSNNGWTIAAFDLEAEQWLPDLLHGPAVLGQPASYTIPQPLSADFSSVVIRRYADASSFGTELCSSINSIERIRRSLAEVNRHLAAIYSTSVVIDLWLLMSSGEKAQWCKRCRVHTSSSMGSLHYWLSPIPMPLWVLDDGRVAFCLQGTIFAGGTLWMYDPKTEACTFLSTCLKIGASGYTGNLLRQQVQYAHGTEKL